MQFVNFVELVVGLCQVAECSEWMFIRKLPRTLFFFVHLHMHNLHSSYISTAYDVSSNPVHFSFYTCILENIFCLSLLLSFLSLLYLMVDIGRLFFTTLHIYASTLHGSLRAHLLDTFWWSLYQSGFESSSLRWREWSRTGSAHSGCEQELPRHRCEE